MVEIKVLIFWCIISCFIGGIVGFFTAAILAVSKRADDVYRGRRRKK